MTPVPFEPFTIEVRAKFAQFWEMKCSFRTKGDKLVIVFTGERRGGYYRNNSTFARPLLKESPWKAALHFAASVHVGYLIPPQVLQSHLWFHVGRSSVSLGVQPKRGGFNHYAELVALALIRQDLRDRPRNEAFIDQSMYGKAFLTLSREQVVRLGKEFGSFIDRHDSGGFPAFLERWRALDAPDWFDRNDLGGFLSRFRFGEDGVTAAAVIQQAEAENEEALRKRVVYAEPLPVKRGGLVRGGFKLAEEVGLAGVSLTLVGAPMSLRPFSEEMRLSPANEPIYTPEAPSKDSGASSAQAVGAYPAIEYVTQEEWDHLILTGETPETLAHDGIVLRK